MITRYFIRADYTITDTNTGAKSSLQSELVRGKNNSELSFAKKTEAREHMATLLSTKINGNYRRDYTYHIEAVEYYDQRITSAGLQIAASSAGSRGILRSLINPVL